MRDAFICLVIVKVLILAACCKGIYGHLGGSRNCTDLSLRTLPAFNSKFKRLHILNIRSGDPRNSLYNCRIVSVKLYAEFGYESLSKRKSSRWYSKIVNEKHQVVLFDYIPNESKLVVALNCHGKKCIISSTVNSPTSEVNHWNGFKRQLLSLKSISKSDDIQHSMNMFSACLAVAAIISLVVMLAMCACDKNNVNKRLSDEVGGAEFDQQVVGVSSIDRNHQQETHRKDTASSRNSENGGTRTSSHSSQQNYLQAERTSRLESSGSQSSTKQSAGLPENSAKIEDISLTTSNSERVGNNEKVRSQSTKEQTHTYADPIDSRGFSQSDTFVYKGNEANIATPTSSRKQPVQLISKRDSDKKEVKEREVSQKGKRSWLRRKSSKTKTASEASASRDDKKANSRHSGLPLPPTPENKDAPTLMEENQYETVERKTTNMGTKSDNILDSRPSSELYACIEDDNDTKRNSDSHMYDIVEVRGRPPQVEANPSGLEYAYTVVAPKDNPIKPTETSSGSGLYEVVTDDMKKNIPAVLVESDYAVVQKDSSKKKSSSASAARPLSDTNIAPVPPPLQGMPPTKRRTQSEGENLNVVDDNLFVGEPADHTYAKVNKLRKTHHPEASKDKVDTPSNFLMEGLGDESEEPPPIPPSLYAELPVKAEEGNDATAMTTVRADSFTRVIDTSSYVEETPYNKIMVTRTETTTEVSNFQRNNIFDVKVSSAEDLTRDSQGRKDTMDSDTTVKVSIDDNNTAPTGNPLYDVVHYV